MLSLKPEKKKNIEKKEEEEGGIGHFEVVGLHKLLAIDRNFYSVNSRTTSTLIL
jgi:hypothetical protein